MFYHCLGYIHLVIDGYSYATRLGWIFPRFVSYEQTVDALMQRVRKQRHSFLMRMFLTVLIVWVGRSMFSMTFVRWVGTCISYTSICFLTVFVIFVL